MNAIRILIDTNIILAGTFFSGIEGILLNIPGVDILTADICLDEAVLVAERIFTKLNIQKEDAIGKLMKSFESFDAIEINSYRDKLPESEKLVNGKNDQKVLAAVLASKPDYFVTGDSHFHKKPIKRLIRVRKTRQVLEEIGVI